jgi:multiple antibiotic resistance protein
MGGLLIAMIGVPMLQGRASEVHSPASGGAPAPDAQVGVAVSPLAIPILAGPGTIATAMSFAGRGGSAQVVSTLGAFLLLCLVTYLFFRSGERLVRFLGPHAIAATTRMMGLLLAVIGTQMVIEGIRGTIQAPGS